MKLTGKLTASLMSVLIAGASVLPAAAATSPFSFTAAAAEVYYVEDGVYHLRGTIKGFKDIESLASNPGVVYLTADKGTVMPADCSQLFSSNETLNGKPKYWLNVDTIDLSQADFSKVTDASYMFAGCPNLVHVDLTGARAGNVTDISHIFEGCPRLSTVDLAGFDHSSLQDTSYAFADCGKLSTIYVSEDWALKKQVKKDDDMFLNCTSVKGGNGTTYSEYFTDSSWTFVDRQGWKGYFTDKPCCSFDPQTSTLRLSGYIYAPAVSDQHQNTGIKYVVADRGSVLPADCDSLFANFPCESIDLQNADSSEVKDMSYMFSNCSELKALTLGDGFITKNTSKVNSMFYGCSALESLDLRGADISSANDLSFMFYRCESLKVLDLSSFNTSGVTDVRQMFRYCSQLKTIYAGSGWDLSNVTFFAYALDVFTDCNKLSGGLGTVYDKTNTGADYARIDREGQPGYLTDTSKVNINMSHNVSLKNDFSIVYYIPVSELEGFTDIKLTLSKEVFNADGTVSRKKTVMNAGSPVDSGYGPEYEFRYTGIAAKEMGSNILAVITAKKNGKTITAKPDVYSIKTYAQNKLADDKTNSKLKRLLVNMLNYGAAAQTYFGYNTSSLANKDLSYFDKRLATEFSEDMAVSAFAEKKLTGAKAKFSGKNLSLGNNISIVYFMTFDSSVDRNKVSLRLTYADINNKLIIVNVPFSSFTKGDNPEEYRYDLKSISAKDSLQPVNAVIMQNGKAISDTLTYSIPTYVRNKLNKTDTSEELKTIVKALIVYYTSARNYFS